MGCCYSSVLAAVEDDGCSPAAMVVAPDSSLLEYSSSITAAEVVVEAGKDYVLCSSDKLFFDSYPQAARPDEELEPGQIYFLLPSTERRRRLTGENVAALAIRASLALKQATEKQGKRRKMRVVWEAEAGSDGGNLKWCPPPVVAAAAPEKKNKFRRLAGTKPVGLRRELSAVQEVDEDCVNMLFDSH